MLKKTKVFLLALMVAALGIFLPTDGATQESTSFTEKIAKLKGLQAEQDALGKKWLENQEKLEQLGQQFETLDREVTEGLGRLGTLRAEAETKVREYERKLPEIEKRHAVIEAKRQELNQEYNAYSAQCDVTVSEEEYPSRVAMCDAWYGRFRSAWDENERKLESSSREAQTLEEGANSAIEAHDNLLEELQQKEAQQQELLRQGLALEASSAELLEAGRKLDILIKELEGSICRPGDFQTAEAFEECMRVIFGEGGGPKGLPPVSPIDMSPTDQRQTSPYDLDPNVVKPDWEDDDND